MALNPDPDDNLIAAAEAAASWARARRAKWTKAPLPTSSAPSADEPFVFEFEPHTAAPPTAATVPPVAAAPPVVTHPPAPSPLPRAVPPVNFDAPAAPAVHFDAPAAPTVHFDPPPAPTYLPPPAPVERGNRSKTSRLGAVRELSGPILEWAPRVAAAAAVIVGGVVAAPYVRSVLSNLSTREAPAEKPRPAAAAAGPRKSTGTLTVNSTPPGARVLVDGKPRGVTPLELADVAPGRHEIALRSDAGSVRRTVTVAAGKTTAVDESIFSGWVALYSPFEVTVAEGGRVLRPDDRNQIMLAPGVHTLRFVNKTFAFDSSRQVEVKPGEGTTVRLAAEPSQLTVTATEPAEVWVDGTRIGDAPVTGAPVPVGTHEILVRRTSDGAERRSTVTVGVAPFTLHIDFSQPGA